MSKCFPLLEIIYTGNKDLAMQFTNFLHTKLKYKMPQPHCNKMATVISGKYCPFQHTFKGRIYIHIYTIILLRLYLKSTVGYVSQGIAQD